MTQDDIVTPREEWNQGAGDRDHPYQFGRPPSVYMTWIEHARLLILRSKIYDRHLLKYRRPE